MTVNCNWKFLKMFLSNMKTENWQWFKQHGGGRCLEKNSNKKCEYMGCWSWSKLVYERPEGYKLALVNDMTSPKRFAVNSSIGLTEGDIHKSIWKGFAPHFLLTLWEKEDTRLKPLVLVWDIPTWKYWPYRYWLWSHFYTLLCR